MYRGTSTTSLTIASSGSFSVTTQSGLEWIAGDPVIIWSEANPSNWIAGTITAYSGTALDFDATGSGGSGTYSDWKFNLAGSVAQLQMRRGLASEWASTNPILARAEFGVEKSDSDSTIRFKIGDGSTAWNDLPYAGGGGGGSWGSIVGAIDDQGDLKARLDALRNSLPAADVAMLVSGSVVVPAPWVTAESIIVVTPTSAPSTAGTVIYADPADIVPGTSFTIRSDDATDARGVFWMAREPSSLGLGFPETFYVSFRTKFSAAEIASVYSVYEPSVFRFNITSPEIYVNDFSLALESSDGSNYDHIVAWIDVPPGYPSADLTGFTIAPDTFVYIDIKFVVSPDHKAIDITFRLNGTEVGVLHADAASPWRILNFGVGQPDGGAPPITVNRDVDYLYIGTTGYGSYDLFAADFTTDESPFDSLVTNGDGAITFPDVANMHVESTTGDADCAFKNTHL
jgi:hypothetical protein